MTASGECRRKRELPKNRREKYIFILVKYLPLSHFDISASTDKQMILGKAKELLKKLPKETRSEEELRQLKNIPDPIYYGIVIYDNTTGEIVDSVIVTEQTTLPAY